jgi:hypothetical protein
VKAVELRDISDKVYTVSGSGGADCVGIGIGINVISVGINQPDPKPKTDQTNSNKNTQTDPEAADASAKAMLGEQLGLYQNTYAANTSYDKLLDLFSTDLATGATLTEEQKTAAKEKHKNGTKKENKLPTGVHVNLTNVTADAGTTGATSVKAEEKNRVELTADALTLSAGNVAIGVDNAFLDLAHATDITLDKSSLRGKEVKVGTFLDNNPRSSSDKYAGIDNVTYAASIAISPTTLISGAVTVVMNKVNITGTSGITVKDTDIVEEGEDDNGNVTIETNDKTKAATHLFGVAGSTILGVNTIWSWVQNTHTMGISFENTNANAVNTVSGKNIFVGSKNTTNLSAQGTGVAVGGEFRQDIHLREGVRLEIGRVGPPLFVHAVLIPKRALHLFPEGGDVRHLRLRRVFGAFEDHPLTAGRDEAGGFVEVTGGEFRFSETEGRFGQCDHFRA